MGKVGGGRAVVRQEAQAAEGGSDGDGLEEARGADEPEEGWEGG